MARSLKIEDALDYCLRNPDGLTFEQLLARFPEHAEQLQPLLNMKAQLDDSAPAPVPTERREAMKRRLMDAAAARRAGQTAPVPVPVRPEKRPSRIAFTFPWPRLAWAGALAAVVLLVLAWWGSSGALPGNPLYEVKVVSERLSLNLASGPAEQVRAHTQIANIRLGEIATLEQRHEITRTERPLNDYHYHISLSAGTLDATQDGTRTELAQEVYKSSVQGSNIFQELSREPNVPPAVQASLSRAIQATESINQSTALVLQAAGIDPDTVAVLETAATPAITSTPRTEAQSGPPTATPSNGGAAPGTEPTALPGKSTVVAGGSPSSRSPLPAPGKSATPTRGRVIVAPTRAPATATPTPTPRPGGGGGAATATRTHTAATSTAVPSYTPLPTFTHAATVVPQPTTQHGPPTQIPPVRTRTPGPPTGVPPVRTHTPGPPTQVPPTHTTVVEPTHTPPPPPTATGVVTPAATATTEPRTATDTPEPTETRTPTYTPEPVPTVNVCEVEVGTVDAQCASGTCVNWSAEIVYDGSASGSVNWTAQLQIKQPQGGFHTVATAHGSASIGQGGTNVAGTLCYPFPADAQLMKVIFSVDAQGSECSPHGDSGAQDSCNVENYTPTPRPSRTPQSTHAPESTGTPRPSETPDLR